MFLGSGFLLDFSLKLVFEESKLVCSFYMFIDEYGINIYGVKFIVGCNYIEDEVIVIDNYDELLKVIVVIKILFDELFFDGNGLG